MKPPEAVVFDLGNVLVNIDYSGASRGIEARSPLTRDQVGRFVAQSPLLVRYETGGIGTEEFLAQARQSIGFRGRDEELGHLFADIFSPIEAMVDAQDRIRRSGVPTFIFSNTNPLHVEHIRRRFPFFRNFDGYILSFEHGAMKPNPGLYEVVERVTRLQGADLLYLDDRPENVETAAKRGWRAILHQSPDQSLESIRASGLQAARAP
jgi:FMN phosphatase YigB (HAD superfamily)